jgi:hypothetical protein
MSDTALLTPAAPVAEAPKAAKPTKKATKKVSKPSAKKAAKKAAEAKGSDRSKVIHGVQCLNGKFWNEKRIDIVTAMRRVNATSAQDARTAEEISRATKSKMEAHFVSRYCAEQEPLVFGGIVKRTEGAGEHRAMGLYLSALGVKCKFDY